MATFDQRILRIVTFQTFVLKNARWLVGGLGLTYFSSFGQTFFIALFAGELRADFGLTHGQFGSLYMFGTLASAITLVFIGKVVDHYSVRQVSGVVLLALSTACIAMATAQNVITLVFAIFLLRLSGQGMMTHTAVTAMGRWFVAERGRAVAVTNSGHQLGEACMPLAVFSLLNVLGWRQIWILCAIILLVIAVAFSCPGLSEHLSGFIKCTC